MGLHRNSGSFCLDGALPSSLLYTSHQQSFLRWRHRLSYLAVTPVGKQQNSEIWAFCDRCCETVVPSGTQAGLRLQNLLVDLPSTGTTGVHSCSQFINLKAGPMLAGC